MFGVMRVQLGNRSLGACDAFAPISPMCDLTTYQGQQFLSASAKILVVENDLRRVTTCFGESVHVKLTDKTVDLAVLEELRQDLFFKAK